MALAAGVFIVAPNVRMSILAVAHHETAYVDAD